MNVTDILLAASVGCNLWFLFLLLYDKIMEVCPVPHKHCRIMAVIGKEGHDSGNGTR